MNDAGDQQNYAAVADLVGRARALMNHDSGSDTFGCADRDYWYYRTRASFASAPWQQLMLGFAALASNPGTREIDRPALIENATAALLAWIRAQHRDGSVDEWYRNEHSYCATAFGLAGAAQTILLVGDRIPRDAVDEIITGAERAGVWLSARWNAAVMNQNLAATLGLWCLGRVTGKAVWSGHAESKFEKLKGSQHAEGWFPEYDGMDFGYSSLALDLLAGADHWGMDAARPMAERLSNFIASVIGTGGVVPGRVGSRGTTHAFAFGAEHFAATLESSAMIRAAFREGHRNGLLNGPADVDDRYFAYFYFPQFALAHGAAMGAPPSTMSTATTKQRQEVEYDGCGLTVRTWGDGDIHLSRRLGGAIAITRPLAKPVYHLGYEITDQRGIRYSSATWSADSLPVDHLSAEANFQRVSDKRPLERWMIPFTIAVSVLAIPGLADLFAWCIKRLAIRPRARLRARMTRSVRHDANVVVIKDLIVVDEPTAVRNLRQAGEIGMHSPSARMDAAQIVPASSDMSTALLQLNTEGRCEVETQIRIEPVAQE